MFIYIISSTVDMWGGVTIVTPPTYPLLNCPEIPESRGPRVYLPQQYYCIV